MEEQKRIKKHIWICISGLLLIPYPLLISYGVLAEQYPQLYRYADLILWLFIVIAVGFIIAFIRNMIHYRKTKQR